MIVYDVNTYLKENTELLTICGRNTTDNPLAIHPGVGYESEESPIILYFWEPNFKSPEAFFINVDCIVYRVLDVDADRCFRVAQKITNLLSVADGIQGAFSSSYIPKWMILKRSSNMAPTEREGFYSVTLEFDIGYVKDDS